MAPVAPRDADDAGFCNLATQPQASARGDAKPGGTEPTAIKVNICVAFCFFVTPSLCLCHSVHQQTVQSSSVPLISPDLCSLPTLLYSSSHRILKCEPPLRGFKLPPPLPSTQPPTPSPLKNKQKHCPDGANGHDFRRPHVLTSVYTKIPYQTAKMT